MYTDKEIGRELLNLYNLNELKGYSESPKLTVEQLQLAKNKFLNNYNYSYDSNDPGFKKMILTKYFSVSLDKIPKGLTGFILGKRFTKVKTIKDSMEFYGLNWERKDQSKADFYIVGDKLSQSDLNLIRDSKQPIVMDDELRVDSYFSVYNKAKIKVLDNKKLINFFEDSSYKNLKMVCSLLKFVHRDAIEDINKFRLLRLYVDVFYSQDFDLKNKEHINFSDTVQRFCIPHHRYYVTQKFLRKDLKFSTLEKDVSRLKLITGDLVISNANFNNSWGTPDTCNVLPVFKDSEKVMDKDIEDRSKHSLVKVSEIKRAKDFCNIENSVVSSGLISSLVKFNIKHYNNFDVSLNIILNKESKELSLVNLSFYSNYNNYSYYSFKDLPDNIDMDLVTEFSEKTLKELIYKVNLSLTVDKDLWVTKLTHLDNNSNLRLKSFIELYNLKSFKDICKYIDEIDNQADKLQGTDTTVKDLIRKDKVKSFNYLNYESN